MMLQCHRVATECHWRSVYIHKTNKQHCGRVYQFIFILFIFYEKRRGGNKQPETKPQMTNYFRGQQKANPVVNSCLEGKFSDTDEDPSQKLARYERISIRRVNRLRGSCDGGRSSSRAESTGPGAVPALKGLCHRRRLKIEE